MIAVLSMTILNACGETRSSSDSKHEKQENSAESFEESGISNKEFTFPNKEPSDTDGEKSDDDSVSLGEVIKGILNKDGTDYEEAAYEQSGTLDDLTADPSDTFVDETSDSSVASTSNDTVIEGKNLLGIITDNDRLFEATDYDAFCKANGLSQNDYEGYETYSAYSLEELKDGVSLLAEAGCSTIILGNTSFIVSADILSSLGNEFPDVSFKESDESILIITEADRDSMIYTTYFGILRDDVFLSLNSISGFKDYFNKTKQIKGLYTTIGANGMYRGGYAFSNENIPVPCLEENDQIICYSSTDVPSIDLYPAEFIGFSPRFYLADIAGGSDYYMMYNNRVDVPNHNIRQIPEDTMIEVTDENGNLLEDYNNVPENTLCTISWYEGTQYNEEKLVANCRVYRISETPAFEIEGALTKSGYAEYDFSSVPSGLYRVTHDGGLILIQ